MLTVLRTSFVESCRELYCPSPAPGVILISMIELSDTILEVEDRSTKSRKP